MHPLHLHKNKTALGGGVFVEMGVLKPRPMSHFEAIYEP